MGLALLAPLLSLQALAVEADGAEGVLEEVVVTGSRIRRADVTAASPVITITADHIRDAGYSNFQEVLATLTQNSGGSLDQQQVFGFTPAASAVNLRGVGIGRTLTLMDGKRTPRYPIAAGGTENFSDTANVPLAAVERVEVLTSGASALYGSDAMGGVVNIILKEAFQGLQIDGRYLGAEQGGLGTANLNLLLGAGGVERNVLLLVEHERNDRLKATQRNGFNDLGSDLAFGGIGSYSAYGLSLRTPADEVVRTLDPATCAARGLQPWPAPFQVCGFDRASRRDLFPDRERTSVMGRWSLLFAGNLEFYGRLDYSHSRTRTEIEPMAVDDYRYFVGLDAGASPDPGFVTLLSERTGETARFPQAAAFGGDFAGQADGEYLYYRRMVEFGNRTNDITVDNYGFLTGVRGELDGGWSWDLDWWFMRTGRDARRGGFASAGTYFEFLASGPAGRSQFDRMTLAEVAAARYVPTQDGESSINQFSFNMATANLFELPTGAVGFAFGAETAREWFSSTADPETLQGNVLATGASSGAGRRRYSAAYAEFVVPVLDRVDLQAAFRYDDYNDFGDNVSPLVAAVWRVSNSVRFRAGWARTFRAPDLQRVYGDPARSFAQVTDPVACEFQGGSIGDPGLPACRGEVFTDVTTGPNPDLNAEEGENWNLGVTLQAAGIEASLDFWRVEVTDMVNSLDAQTMVNNPEEFDALITRNPLTLEAVHVDATARNLTRLETRGVDLVLGYGLDTRRAGFWDFTLRGTYLSRWDEQFFPTSPVTDVIRNSRVPEWRWNFTGNWTWGQWGATLFVSYVGSMNGLNSDLFTPGDPDNPRLTVGSWTTANLSGYWADDVLRVQAGVNNLANQGPKADETDAWPFYPRGYQNAVGRQYYLRVTYHLGG